MQTIYRPRGRALEYAYLAMELFRSQGSDVGGCVHGCKYCYVPGVVKCSRKAFACDVRPREGLVEALAKVGLKWYGTKDRVLLSFFSDVYQPVASTGDFVRQVLTMMNCHHIPFTVLTKAPTAAVADEMWFGANDSLGVTMTFWDANKSRRAEPLAESPQARAQALKFFHGRGVATWVSLEPVLDVTETMQVIDETYEFVDQYRIGTLNHLPSKIDWRDFGIRVIAKMDRYDKDYYIKRDLARYLGGIGYTNTDTRQVTPRVTRINK